MNLSPNKKGPAAGHTARMAGPSTGTKNNPRMGVGIDVERVARFRGITRDERRFLESTFSKQEMAYCKGKADPPVHFAGIFAAKEAALKAVGSLREGKFNLVRFEVLHDAKGAPVLRYSGANAGLLEGVSVEISISHTFENAVAVALGTSSR